ncbi:magnesium transporter, partial [Tremellales sp. Uapishka_1]
MDPTAPPTLDIPTLTSTAWQTLSTISDGIPTIFQNGTQVLPLPDVGDGDVYQGSYVLNTFIGLILVLIASLLNAFGLNLTKLDHLRSQSIPKRERKKVYMRGMWLAGMGIYIASQVFGSPLALRYLRPDWVAPLGSSSLVFNFLFARWLVGTPVTTSDVRGTALIVLGVILILIFSSINHGLDQTLSVHRLDTLWTRGSWLGWFPLVSLFTALAYLFSHLLSSLLKSRASFSPLPSPTLNMMALRPENPSAIVSAWKGLVMRWKGVEKQLLLQLEKTCQRTDDSRLVWLQGVGWAVAGGSLAGLCLVFTKAVVKMFSLPGHPLVHASALLSLLLVVFTAVLQIVCLNRALQCADTVVIVPVFYAGYTVLGFINSLIFYNETGQYARWVLGAVFISIAVLISGVVLLSLKPSSETEGETVSTQPNPSMRLRPRPRETGAASSAEGVEEAAVGVGGEGEVMWEVGSSSDVSEGDKEEDEEKRIGVGGTRGSMGERGGLLFANGGEEHDEDQESVVSHGKAVEEDDFGDYEEVKNADDLR